MSMSKEATKATLNSVMTKAEAVAMALIENDLRTNDPRYAPLCKKLERFRPLLAKHKTGTAPIRELLVNGFRTCGFKVNPAATEDAEVLRLLDMLAGKLGGMAAMLGGLL